MKTKILSTICLLFLLTIQAFTQSTWVPFLQQTRTKPTTNLSTSNNTTVSFIVQINGMESSNITVDSTVYQTLSIPDGDVMRKQGSPQVPVIRKLIAIPDCDGVNITVTPSNQIEFSNYRVVPSPRYEKKYFPDGDHDLIPVYEEDKSIYSTSAFFPGKYGEIIDTGHVRGQKVARVVIYPIQYNPVSKQTIAFANFTVNLSFVNPKSAVNKELGIFRNMMHHAAVNYALNGISASTIIKDTIKGNQIGKVSPGSKTLGSVTQVTNLNSLVGTGAFPVDYLILTHSSLFNSSSLSTLANYRANHNGYDVVIVKVDDIYGNPNYNTSGIPYTELHAFIADVYNRGKANHTGDGHLAYILLAGDAYINGSSTPMVPANYSYDNTYEGLDAAGDYYYACTGTADYQTLMYGRLPVDNETELSNIVTKIQNYEANTNKNWNENYTFMAFSPDFFAGYSNSAMKTMIETVPTSSQKYYAWRGYAADTAQQWGRDGFSHHPNNDSSLVNLNEVTEMWDREYTSWSWIYNDTTRYGGQYNNGLNNCGADSINTWLYNKLNAGMHTFIYEGHGGWDALGANEGCGRYIFRSENTYPPCGTDSLNTIYNRLSNNLYPFMIFDACDAGQFDNGNPNLSYQYDDCLAEKVLKSFSNKGAIGVLASTRDSYAGAFGKADGCVLEAQYDTLAQIMGEAVMESKLNASMDVLFKRQYNLYGDPALNLWPTGQTLTQNTTISGKNYFSTNITVPSGITLTISAGSTLIFNDTAKLIVNGTLTANGGSASTPIKFNFISPSSSNGIIFNSGSSGTINYCKVVHACNGIYENGVSINITNSAIDSCTNGIYLYGVSPTIQSCNINYNTYAGIYLINSSPYLYNNCLLNNDYGVYCTTSSKPNFGYGTTQGKNQDSANVYGVYCWNNSIPMLGNNSNGGYNNLVNTTWNVYNMSSSSIYGENNWWGTSNPNNFKIGGTGSVVYTPYCTTRVSTTTPPLSKSSANMYIAQGNDIPLLSELNKAYQYLASNNTQLAKAVCLNLVNNYPDYSVSFNALNLLKETYSADQIDSVKNIYQSLFNKNVKKRLYAMAGLILADIDKDNKLQHLNDVINSYGQDSVLELALFDKFVYYHFEKNDIQNALAVSKQLDNSFTLGQGAIEAHQILGDKGYYGIDVNKGQALPNIAVQTPTNYALLDNYPNPFNPSTTINYQLPMTNYVTLKVYDILGREVKTLVNELQHAGTYSVNFDASKLASGVYFYRLHAGNFVSTKKMQLLK